MDESHGNRCAQCGGAIDDTYRRCRLCAASTRWRQRRGDAPAVVHVVEQATVGSQVHERMRWYKDAAEDSARRQLTLNVASRLAGWIDCRPELLASVDIVTCVPSRWRAAMEPVVDAVPALVSRHRRLLGARRPADRQHVPDAFSVDSSVRGRRVLVVDDVFVSGATVLSAADALVDAGAASAHVLVMARLSRPEWSARAA